jgi:hypothetical protein
MTVTPQPPQTPVLPPPSRPLTPLSKPERFWATALGVAGGGAGAVATFTTTNGVAAVGLLGFGAIFLFVGVLGIVPTKFKMGENEASLERVVGQQTLRTALDEHAPEPTRAAAQELIETFTVSTPYTAGPVTLSHDDLDQIFRAVNQAAKFIQLGIADEKDTSSEA